MHNHIEFLIGLRKKLILKRRIKIIKKILAEQAIESEKDKLKKRIEIFNINSSLVAPSDGNKYFIFPAKDSFYQKEVLEFKEDIELMLANCFDLFVFIKDDLSFDQILYKEIDEYLPLQPISNISSDNQVSIFNSETKMDKLYLKFVSLPHISSSQKIDKDVQNNNYNMKINKDLVADSNNSISVNNISISQPKKDVETYSNIIKYAIEENKKKMVKALKNMILKHKKFDPEISTVLNRTPVDLIYYSKNNKPILSQYLKSMSIYNMMIKGTFIYFSSCIGFFFKKKNYKKFKNIYKFLFYFFKTMFCLISKPVFVYKTDKIIIQLFYFLIIPNF
jgi:hypothetical protein